MADLQTGRVKKNCVFYCPFEPQLTAAAAAAAESLQLCPTPCDPIDDSPPGFPCPWDSLGLWQIIGWALVLEFYSSCNKAPQPCLKEVYCLTVPEATILKSSCWQGSNPPNTTTGASRVDPSLPLPFSGSPRCSLAYGCITSISPPISHGRLCSVSKFPSYRDTSDTGLKVHPKKFIWTWLHLQRPIFK